MSDPRYQRQVSVPGIGERGQAAIGRAAIEIGGDSLAAEVCALYLAGAGVGTLIVAPRLAGVCEALNLQVDVIARDAQRDEPLVRVAGEAGASFAEPAGGSDPDPDPDRDPVGIGAAAARWALAKILSKLDPPKETSG